MQLGLQLSGRLKDIFLNIIILNILYSVWKSVNSKLQLYLAV